MPRFTITTLLWLTALFATGMGTFGPGWGILATGTVCVAYLSQLRWPTLPEWLVVIGIVGTLIALMFPPVEVGATAGRRYESIQRLRRLTTSMYNFYGAHGALPPGYSTDASGTPLHSWRTLLLPYLNEEALHGEIQFDEPWDSVANKEVYKQTAVDLFCSPMQSIRPGRRDETHYFAVVDEDAVLRPGKSTRIRDIADGASTTILLIEGAPRGICWYEPRDLTMDEAIDLLTGESPQTSEWVNSGFFVSTRYRGDRIFDRNVVFADGHQQSIGHVTTRELARALLTRAGGEEIPDEIDSWEYDRTTTVVGHTVHWRRVLSTTLFVGLAVGPFFRRRNPLEATGVEEVNHEDTKQLVSRSTSHS